MNLGQHRFTVNRAYVRPRDVVIQIMTDPQGIEGCFSISCEPEQALHKPIVVQVPNTTRAELVGKVRETLEAIIALAEKDRERSPDPNTPAGMFAPHLGIGLPDGPEKLDAAMVMAATALLEASNTVRINDLLPPLPTSG